MTPNESANEVKLLAGLFPTLNADQGRHLLEEFIPFDAKTVRMAVKRHRNTYSEFVNIPQLMDAVRAAAAWKQKQANVLRADEIKTQAEWDLIDSSVNGLDEADMETAKQHVIASAPGLTDGVREMLASRHPRTSRLLRGLIYKHVLAAPPPPVRPSSHQPLAAVMASDLDLD